MTVLDCGHKPTENSGLGNGVARFEGQTMCYDCATVKLKSDALMNNHIMAYVSSDWMTITTWDGQALGKVIKAHDSSDGRKTFYVCRLWDGRRWYGVGPAESGTYVSLRPYKNQ